MLKGYEEIYKPCFRFQNITPANELNDFCPQDSVNDTGYSFL
ncbi:MAG TPA: hypothetical protein VN958_13000 [Chitinophagaceae bacterium]|nr:hypothetical protein [Chitinophagaceae bacterium]